MKAGARRGRAVVRRVRSGPGRPPGPSQAGAVRTALVAAATRQYATAGRGGISFGALAEAVGIHKATVFHYFATKDAVVDAVFAAFGAELASRRREWFAPSAAAYPVRLERVIGGLVDFYDADPLRARVICHGLLEFAGPSRGGAAAVGSLGGFVEEFVAFLRAGMAAGSFHPGDPAGLMMTIGGMILFEVMVPAEARRLYGRQPTPAARRREVITLVGRAVAKGDGR